ncbi:hypothetical protein Vadar_019806 [Vaccinium darrowii]|uniref:Uncharacterized protein n=1 Tax=Vaccinium darrowii TaxID=229202 RepID=A0ACB7YEL2_9ERIC|nr:hypothetical protein Vadar_019806 [Vaccinium darrowii]
MRATKARKGLMGLALLAICCCFLVESVSGGEMGGVAVRSSSSSSSSSSRSRSRSSYHTEHHHYSSCCRQCSTILESSSCPDDDLYRHDRFHPGTVIVALLLFVFYLCWFLTLFFGEDSVLVLQVCFDGATEQVCRDLELISETRDSPSPDSRTPRGLLLLLSDTASYLYRRCRHSSFSADSNVKKKRQLTDWKKSFDLMYKEELKKLHAHVHANGCGEGLRGNRATCRNHRYVIVTILVAANGSYELPAINCYSDFERALHSLTSILDSRIRAVKVLWTSRDDMEDFDSLMPIQM